MEPPQTPTRTPTNTPGRMARARLAVLSRPIYRTRLLIGVGATYGVIGGLLGGLNVLGVALAIALNQQQIMRYQDEYAAYQQCLRENAPPSVCQPPTDGALAVSVVWLLFLGACLVTFVLSQCAYGFAARAIAVRTHSRSAAVTTAMLAGFVGWLLYLVASVAAVFAQASPLTMTAPPPGVDTSALHLGAAIGNALVDALSLLPTLVVASIIGLIVALRTLRSLRHQRTGTDAAVVVVVPAQRPKPASSRAGGRDQRDRRDASPRTGTQSTDQPVQVRECIWHKRQDDVASDGILIRASDHAQKTPALWRYPTGQ